VLTVLAPPTPATGSEACVSSTNLPNAELGTAICACTTESHTTPFLIAITGGPGAGKTAILELAKRVLCPHVAILPEAATIIFGGGFWRRDTDACRQAAQRIIFHVQRQLETVLVDDRIAAVGLCDRGTVDGMAYWPGDEAGYYKEMTTTRTAELGRYRAVIHLRTPKSENGYNHQNPARIENAREARRLDEAILRAWDGHPRRTIIESSEDFASKISQTLAAIIEQLPPCCRTHDLQRALGTFGEVR
jgi:predicted ATPase